MRRVTNIKLDQLIIHILDKNSPNGLFLSERTIPLEDNPSLVDYIIGHIQHSLKDSSAKAADFVIMNSGITSGICKDLLSDKYLFDWDEILGQDSGKLIDFLKQTYNLDIDITKIHKISDDKITVNVGTNLLLLTMNNEKTQMSLTIENYSTYDLFNVKTENCKLKIYKPLLNFVEGSRKLAQKLYEIIYNDDRINACDLVVCFYLAENGDGVSRYLALLNIEPAIVFRHKQESDSKGLLYVNFEVDTEAMPTLGEKLQKCAFIRQLEPKPDYDMILLDRQKKGEEVAIFFVDKFMGAKLTLDSTRRTDLLYRTLHAAHNEIRSALQSNENETLHQAIQLAINLDKINIDNWIDELPLSDDHKQHINQVVSDKLPDREFEIDRTYSEKKFNHKRKFEGDFGLKIVVDAQADKFEEIVKSVDRITDDPEKPPYYRIEIHTEKWDEVP